MRELAAVGILFAVVIALLMVVPLAGRGDDRRRRGRLTALVAALAVVVGSLVGYLWWLEQRWNAVGISEVLLGAPLGERDVVDAFTGEVEPVAGG